MVCLLPDVLRDPAPRLSAAWASVGAPAAVEEMLLGSRELGRALEIGIN